MVKNKKNLKKIKSHNFKNKKIKKIKSRKFLLILIKVLLIVLFLLGIYYSHYNLDTFENKISLLAVSENPSGEISGGSIVNLKLEIKSGTGKTFVNLNSIEEVDTQISIINSKKIACNLFRLDCDNYDFYYEFGGSSLILKGPSASSAIAILTAKTLNHIKINKNIAITGSLNSGGIIGNVGGVEEKINVAKQNGFKKVIIPFFDDYNISSNNFTNLKVLKLMDIIDAYNEFGGDNFELKIDSVNNDDYLKAMNKLGNFMCDRSLKLKNEINYSKLKINSSYKYLYDQALKNINYSILAEKNSNYYSMGSFCFNSNLKLRSLININNNLSMLELDNNLNDLSKKINLKYINLTSDKSILKIKSINDFYSFLIINNRIDEAKQMIKEANNLKPLLLPNLTNDEIEKILELDFNNLTLSKLKNNLGDDIYNSLISKLETKFYKQQLVSNVSLNTNMTNNNTININSSNENKLSNITIISNLKLLKIELNNIYSNKINLLSYATERFYTVNLWELFITGEGEQIKFKLNDVEKACNMINREIQIKGELLKNYNLNFFEKQINEQMIFQNSMFTNQYLCIYNGFELNAKINTVLNSFGIKNGNNREFIETFNKFSRERVGLNSNGNFPLIPYIYSEYASDLFIQNDTSSSLLYSNYALSYLDLNLYLEKEKSISIFDKNYFEKLFNNYIFVGAFLVLIGFLDY